MKTAAFDREETLKAMHGVSGGFVWSATPQGWDYWNGVYSNLWKLANERWPDPALEADPFSVGG